MMYVDKHQRGMTTTAWIMLLVGIGIVAWLAIKIVPFYIDNGKVSNALENVKSDAKTNGYTSKNEVKAALLRRLSIDNVTAVNGANFDEIAKHERTGDGFILTVNYANETPLFGNLYLAVKFEKTIQVP
jgi:hypothetical protein